MKKNKNKRNFKKTENFLEAKEEELRAELRQDLITGNWVVISPRRKRRPHTPFRPAHYKYQEEKKCIFCDPAASGQEKDVLIYGNEKNWTLRVFPNKYPAFQKGIYLNKRFKGPFFAQDAIGFHEIIVTRDHQKSLGEFGTLEIAEVLKAYQERYIKLMNKKFVQYISIFHNHGPTAGASVAHPHSQLIAVPIVSRETQEELKGAEDYFLKNRECVFCRVVANELTEKTRLVFQNDYFVVFCPFASRMGYEMWVLPKEHQFYFERLGNKERSALGEALKQALARLYKLLDNPDYNFYLNTSPCDGQSYDYYHWHIEILPKYSTWAGFELGTGIEINTVIPEIAARELREVF